jgi:hypothetical protein
MRRARDLLGGAARGPGVRTPQCDHLRLLLVADMHPEQHRQTALGGQPDTRRRGAGDDDLRTLGARQILRRPWYDRDFTEAEALARAGDGGFAQPAHQQIE